MSVAHICLAEQDDHAVHSEPRYITKGCATRSRVVERRATTRALVTKGIALADAVSIYALNGKRR